MDSSIKTLTITGGPSVIRGGDPTKPRTPRQSRQSRKRAPAAAPSAEFEDDDGGEEEVAEVRSGLKITKTDAIAPLAPIRRQPTPVLTHTPVVRPTPVVTHTPVVRSTPAPTVVAKVSQVVQATQVVQAPQAAQSVVLKKPNTSRVKLGPLQSPIRSNNPKPIHTRKARRIVIPNMSPRFTRAKKLGADTKKQTIDAIRNFLINKGVIQEKSKAPENMLRSMYNDFNLLKDTTSL